MKHFTPQQMIAFHDELAKEAGIGSWLRSGYRTLAANPRLRQTIGYGSALLPSTYGRQLALGAALGGGAGAAASEEGEGLKGALKGALIGTGIAGGRILATSKGREALKGGLGKFYERQRYGVTGQFGKHVGKSEAEQLAHARKIGLVPAEVNPAAEQFTQIGESPSMLEKVKSKITRKAPEGARAKAVRKAQEYEKEMSSAFKSGYMNAPGVVHGMLTEPGQLMRGAWRRAGTPGKVFAGLGAYETGKGLIETPEPGGPGRLEKGLRGAGSTVGWLVAPHAILGGHIVGTAGGSIGGAAGKLGDIAVRAARPGRVAPPPSAYYPPYGGE